MSFSNHSKHAQSQTSPSPNNQRKSPSIPRWKTHQNTPQRKQQRAPTPVEQYRDKKYKELFPDGYELVWVDFEEAKTHAILSNIIQ